MNKKELLNQLKNFIKNISFQQVKLISVDFKASETGTGIYYTQGMINRQSVFDLDTISTGETIDNKGNKISITTGSYIFKLTDTIENKKEDGISEQKESAIDPFKIEYQLTYQLILFLNSANIILNESEVLKDILPYFYNESGKMIIFPYIRHIMDMLSREAGFLTPSIQPIIFKK